MRYRILAGLFLAALQIGGANAQSTACVDLAQQLNEINRRPTSYNPYTDAIQRQQQAIDQAESAYQRSCQQGLFSQPSPNCGVLVDRIGAMRANLAKLQRAAPRAVGQGTDGLRERIVAQMQRYRCDEQRQATVSTFDRPQPGTISTTPARGSVETQAMPTGRVFVLPGPNGPMAYREDPGGRVTLLGPADRLDPTSRRSVPQLQPQPQRRETITVSPDDDERPAEETTDEPSGRDFAGSYKTLCVRTCDGFYFPISYSVNRNQFQTDADVCHARCPQTETRLFVVKAGASDEGEQSLAADNGQPYSKLPNALRYRREVVQGCSCGALDPSLMPTTGLNPDDVSADAANKKKAAQMELPLPHAKPIGGEDPETLANAAIGFVPQVIAPVTAAAAPASEAAVATPGTGGTLASDPKRAVRIVGPKFYADR